MVMVVNINEGTILGPFVTALIKRQLGGSPSSRQVAKLLRQAANIGAAMRPYGEIVVTPDSASLVQAEPMAVKSRYRLRHYPEIQIELCQYLNAMLPDGNARAVEGYLNLAEVYAAGQFGALRFRSPINATPSVNRPQVAEPTDADAEENSSLLARDTGGEKTPRPEADSSKQDLESEEGYQNTSPNNEPHNSDTTPEEAEKSIGINSPECPGNADDAQSIAPRFVEETSDLHGNHSHLNDVNEVPKSQNHGVIPQVGIKDDDNIIEDDWLKELGGGGSV